MEGWGFLSFSGEVSREVDVDVAASFECSSAGGWSSVDVSAENTRKQNEATVVWGGRSVFITANEDEISSITNSSHDSTKGASLHDYERITRLGRGGFGSVYKAKNKATGEIVAIKISQYAFPSIKEMEFLQMCNCPQIIRYYSAFKNSDGSSPTMWMVIEYCGGGSVEDLIQTEDLDMYQIATILSGLLKAVVYLHDHDILHRDIKPGNILLTSDGETKLADLGCSRELRKGEMAHTLMGTQAFMAPEFFVGGIGYTQKADIWAIGVTALDIAIKLSCLESPLFYLQLSKADSFESYLRSKLLFYPQSFQDFICACLNPKPSRRPTSRELLEHPFLQEFARDSRCLRQLCRSQEDRLNKDKEIIEPLVRLANASSSKGDTPLKEDLLSACVDVVERIRAVADALMRRSSSVKDPQHVSLFEDLERILDTKSPRVLLVGRTGSGKSALINALNGEYVAPVGIVGPETRQPKWYKFAHKKSNFYVMDSPGRQEVQHANIMEESFVLVEENSLLSLSDCLLEEELPDVVLFLCKADDILRGGDREDIHFLRDVLDETKRRSGGYPFVMGIVTHVDALDPTTELLPSEYGAQKKGSIEIARRKLNARLVDSFANSNTPTRNNNNTNNNHGKNAKQQDGLMPSLVDTIPLSSIMAWDSSKKRFTDYRYNVDTLLSSLTSEKFIARLTPFEEKRKVNVNELFGRRWLKYLQEVLGELKAAGCSQGQYSLLADTILQMLVRLIGAIYHIPTKDVDFFWQKFVEESNLVWDKGEVGKIVAHQWGIFSWTSKPTDCDRLMEWLYASAAHFFSRVAAAQDVQTLAKTSLAELHKKIWRHCT